MKKIKILLLVLIIMAFWTSTALCSRIWPWAKDQNDNLLENSAHTGQVYGGAACNATPTWVVYGRFTLTPTWTGCPTCWAIDTYWVGDWAGYMNWPTKVCGDRYTFNSFSGDMSGSSPRNSEWNPGNYTEPSQAYGIWDGISPGALYNRNARVNTRKYLLNESTGQYGSLESSIQWLKVGEMKYHVPPNRESSNQYIGGVYHFGDNGSWSQPYSQIIANGGPYGYVQDEVNAATSPAINNYLDYYYNPGSVFTLSHDIPGQLTPTFTPAINTALFSGTRYVSKAAASMAANPLPAGDGTEAKWMAVTWDGGTGRVAATGTIPNGSTSISLIPNSTAASTINLKYMKHLPTRVESLASMPDWVRSAFENSYGVLSYDDSSAKVACSGTNCTWYWLPVNKNTIIIPEKLSRIVKVDNVDTEELWVLNKPALVASKPAWATITYDSAGSSYRIQQTNQAAGWTYTIRYSKLTVGVSGIDDANLAKIQGLSGFVPRPSSTSLTAGLNDLTASAPNVIYAEDAGRPNRVRYLLSGWTGTGDIPASGSSAAGAVTTLPIALASDSTITWNYSKQVSVRVTTSGEVDPLKIYDLAGDTTQGSSTISNIVTAWDETVDDNGAVLPTPVRKSLLPGMQVFGNGIADGTVVTEVFGTSLAISSPAAFTYSSTNGQRLTFATSRAYERPATTNGTAVVSEIDTTGLIVGMSASGSGIEDGTVIASIDSSTQLTLNRIASVTRTKAEGQRLAFGSADPRECQAINDFTPANCPNQSAVTFYSFDSSVNQGGPLTQVSKVSLTTRNQYAEAILDADNIPQLQTRTFSQVVFTEGAAINSTSQLSASGDRQALLVTRLFNPIEVSWRYNSTKVFLVGQSIKPPAGVDDLDLETPPVITVPNGNQQLTASSTDFALAWDTSMSSITATGLTVAGSATVTGLSTTLGLTKGMYVYGPGIPDMTKITAVAAGSGQVTLSKDATETAGPVELVFQSRQGERYFPLHPVTSFTINWPRIGTSTPYTEIGTAIWPAKQQHVAGVPANLNPPGAVNSFREVSYPAGSSVVGGVFKPDSAGTTVLRFNTPPVLPDLRSGAAFIVVESIQLRPEQYPDIVVDIGTKITNDSHNDPEKKNGYLFYPGAVIDAVGQDRAYDRDTRTGAIIPVNKSLPGDVNPLMLVWYTIGQGGIGWPTTPMRYKAVWPAVPRTLTIGTGEPVSLTLKPRAVVYNQPNRSLPGFNPNEEHALITGDTLYALRNDLNVIGGHSEPYVLLKYKDTATQEWAMDVYRVERPTAFKYELEVGKPVLSPLPPSFMNPPGSDIMIQGGLEVGGEWHLRDQKGGHWAKAANWKSGDTISESAKSRFVMKWYYYMRADFYWPDAVGYTVRNEGDVLPFLNNDPLGGKYVDGAEPVDVTYVTTWPDTSSVLPVGSTLTTAKNGLPGLYDFMTAEVVFDENVYKGGGPLAKLYAPERYLYTPLAALPAALKKETVNGVEVFPELPFAVQTRLFYDSTGKRLGFKGAWVANEGEENWLLSNLMTRDEKSALKNGLKNQTGVDCSSTPANAWCAAIDALYDKGRNPAGLTYPAGQITNPFNQSLAYNVTEWQEKWGVPLGLELRNNRVSSIRSLIGEKNALTAGMAQGEGYLVIAENNSSDPAVRDLPVALHVIKVATSPVYQGVIKAIKSKNVFDEKLTLHYTGDFGGEPEKFYFEWYYQPVSGSMPALPLPGAATGAWQKFMDPNNTTGAGQTDITIQGASPLTMSDNWVVARYYYKDAWPAVAVTSDPASPATPHEDQNNWSAWSGANIFDSPMLAMGWVKRVVDGLNPLEARVTDFRNNATNTTVSMLSQFGNRYEGDIAFSSDPNYLNSLGLISAYESVLNRARLFSIDAVPPQDYGPTNDALLNITSRLATFYLSLGNEAYADAVDPTIGFSTKSAEYGNMAPSVFAFQNQVDSLLEEELALMRGRDDSAGSTKNAPYYNRLIWNFTQGEGEVAYAQNYNISDQDRSGVINAADAKIMYPQGHGDAWGHYLQSISYYYKLLGHSSFSWEPRVEFVMVAGQPVMVDYLDERRFASIAAQRAKTGAEIVDLTYRKYYTDDPAGQWQGYKDSSANRAWGVDEWARRAGQAAYFDWVTANAILPDSVPATAHDRVRYVADPITGAMKAETIPGADIQQIDRSKVPELKSIAGQFHTIQARMNEVDNGINPLGLVKGVVPFDIDPALLDSGFGFAGQTHFEQIYERAQKALDNAVASYDYANGYTQRLRQNQDTLEDFKKNLVDQERDYRNRLIEIFGYPYGDDIGAGKTYPAGYDGPDIFHYNYVDFSELTGKPNPGFTTYTREFTYDASLMTSLGNLPDASNPNASITHAITYNISTDSYWQVKSPAWTLKRKAPGRLQQALSDLIVAEASYNKSVLELNNLTGGISDAKDNLLKRYNVLAEQIKVRDDLENTLTGLDVALNVVHGVGLAFKRLSAIGKEVSETIVEAIPDDINAWGGDIMSPASAAVRTIAFFGSWVCDIAGDVTDMSEFSMSTAKERVQAVAELKLVKSEANYEVWKLVQDMNAMIAEVDPKLLETYQQKEILQQTAANYASVLAEGVRLMDEREEKRKQAAAEVQEYRYQDLGFRVFRNDAIQKYRAQFDLAAKYVYLAATAYDYETNLLGTASGAGRKFLSEIARQRTLGVISNGVPQAGFPGLADTMARLSQNFSVYKTQLGFNNPQTETTPFSLRTELFRVKGDVASDSDWRNVLKEHKVDDLWKIPEFKRYCRPFAPESAGPQPGIVIKFPTTVTYGKNFFGWPLSGGDSAYSTSNFSTRVRSVGLWFQDYNNVGLSSTPRVYLVPTGSDILRSPTGDGFATREWLVKDQKLPVPFPIGDTDLKNPDFIPDNDSLSDEYAGIRRVSDFRAYPYGGSFDSSQATTDSRLIGRSVWNSQWMLIIPGSTLLFNKDVGLNTFINSVNDIKLFFQTYAYSGN